MTHRFSTITQACEDCHAPMKPDPRAGGFLFLVAGTWTKEAPTCQTLTRSEPPTFDGGPLGGVPKGSR